MAARVSSERGSSRGVANAGDIIVVAEDGSFGKDVKYHGRGRRGYQIRLFPCASRPLRTFLTGSG